MCPDIPALYFFSDRKSGDFYGRPLGVIQFCFGSFGELREDPQFFNRHNVITNADQPYNRLGSIVVV